MRLETIFRSEPVFTRNSPPSASRTLSAEEVQGGGSPPRRNPWVTPHPTSSRKVVSRKPEDLPANSVYINRANQRLDSELPSMSPVAERSWGHKINVAGMRYCRKHYLQASGCPGACGYSHGPLTSGEVLVYRHTLRQQICNTGPQCRDASCFYGHHCSCVKPSCKFPASMHHVDVSSVSVLQCA